MVSQFGDMFMYAYALILIVMNIVTAGMKSLLSKLSRQQDYLNLLQQRTQRHRRF
jgi:hypothetical protein